LFKVLLGLLLLPEVAFADQLNQANTAWVLTSTALVFVYDDSGLSLFYAGLVRSKKRTVCIDAVFCNYLSGFNSLACWSL